MDEKTKDFLAWLDSHGAIYTNINWPTNETSSGMRGATATKDIETNEPILTIPIKLMITPLNALSDPEIGDMIKQSSNFLRGDLLLTFFVMYECIKGTDSFWYPYLRILPEPDPISGWKSEEISMLQSKSLSGKVIARQTSLKNMYERSVVAMTKNFPEKFQLSEYTYELFLFAWNTISARAFGRRLPWSALVPLADCLNHANKQTKYDYNVMDNNVFRLFPTGQNRYSIGCEVFNSYGRRPNENLLMDYGFALLDNEWDVLDINVSINTFDEDEQGDDISKHDRLRALLSVGFANSTYIHLSWTEFPYKELAFFRVLAAKREELDVLWNTEANELSSNITNDKVPVDISLGTQDNPFESNSKSDNTPFIDPISCINEISAIELLDRFLDIELKKYPTTIEEDEYLLDQINKHNRNIDVSIKFDEAVDICKLQAAVTYRLTKKHLIHSLQNKARIIVAYLRANIDEESMRNQLLPRYEGDVDSADASSGEARQNSKILAEIRRGDEYLCMIRQFIS